MKENYKHILKSIFIFSTSSIYFALAYVGFQKQDIDLSKFSTHIGVVENTGETYRTGSKGRKSIVFFVDLGGLNQRLGVYRMTKDYSDLHWNIKKGDTLCVYFESHNTTEDVNIDLIQIEKYGNVIYSKAEYAKKESALIWIGLIAGIVTLIISWLYYKKKLLGMK